MLPAIEKTHRLKNVELLYKALMHFELQNGAVFSSAKLHVAYMSVTADKHKRNYL